MRARTTAAVVLAGAVMVLTAGCNFISPQTTTESYDASDGTSITVGNIDVRNAIVFTGDSGETASLSVTVLNSGDSAATVNFQYDSSVQGQTTESVEVPADGTVSRGTQDGDPQIILHDIDKPAGSLVNIFIQSGSSTGKSLKVPVLDGSFKQYATLLPSPTPAGTATDSATPTP